jgi:hypothetical protein
LKGIDLLAESRTFAERLNSVLNSTITSGVRLSVLETSRGEALIGCGVTRVDVNPRAFLLNKGSQGQRLWMVVSYRLAPDDEAHYLQVNSSVIALTADEDGAEELLHFDYERNKSDDYPEAHLQVVATSQAWDRAAPNRSLGRLHLPVGGRRFRFTLEDVASFLLREKLVTASKGAASTIDEHRAEFERNQLRAAIRRDPETARAFLDELEPRA